MINFYVIQSHIDSAIEEIRKGTADANFIAAIDRLEGAKYFLLKRPLRGTEEEDKDASET